MLQEKATASQKEYEIVLLEVQLDAGSYHLLRKIEGGRGDFSHSRLVQGFLYSPNIGRPAVPPERHMSFRMLLFLGHL